MGSRSSLKMVDSNMDIGIHVLMGKGVVYESSLGINMTS